MFEPGIHVDAVTVPFTMQSGLTWIIGTNVSVARPSLLGVTGITLASDASTVVVGQRVLVTGSTMQGQDPFPNGTVNLVATSGQLSATSITSDANGKFRFTWTPSRSGPAAIVAAAAENIPMSTNTSPGNNIVGQLALYVSPANAGTMPDLPYAGVVPMFGFRVLGAYWRGRKSRTAKEKDPE